MNYSDVEHSTTIYKYFEDIYKKMECAEWIMPLEEQLKYLDQKTSYHMHICKVQRYNADTDVTSTVEEELPLIKFEKVVCKYRPHLHMGDYYLSIDVKSKDTVDYKFYTKLQYSEAKQDSTESEEIFILAYHPHLSNGKPCFGSFQGDIQTALSECNFIRFYSQMKAYLGAYYGRSTYVRGNQFKKDYVYYSFLNKEEVLANFPDHEEGNGDGQVNAITVASDETRWGYPANMKVYGNFIVQGQDLFLYKKLTQNYSRTHLIPEDNESPYALFPWNDGNYDVGSLNCPKAKTMAYVHTLMQVFGFGFLPSFYKVQVFLNTLWAQYSGVTTPELLEQLRQYEQSISNARYGNELTLYGIKFGLTNEESDSLQDIRSKLSSVTNDNTTQNAFFVSLKGCGNVLAKFITLARSDKLHASVLTHFTDGSTSSINASS